MSNKTEDEIIKYIVNTEDQKLRSLDELTSLGFSFTYYLKMKIPKNRNQLIPLIGSRNSKLLNWDLPHFIELCHISMKQITSWKKIPKYR